MDRDKVVHLSLREFTDQLLPVPHDLVSARFPHRRMAEVTAAFVDMVENYRDRAWDHDSDRYLHPEDQLAVEFTQLVNEHVLQYAAGGYTTGTSAEQGASYVMQVFPYKWEPRDTEDVVRLLDDEAKDVSHDADDEDENELCAGSSSDDDRRWSTAALFRGERKPELEPDQPNWAFQSAFVQFTPEGAHNDPFDFRSLADDEELADEYVPVADNRGRIQRQMQSCADHVALYQHRTGVFSLLVGPRTFRVVRWDRSASGVVVSERVDYVRDARALVEVLLALVVADRERVGYDATATRILEGSEDYEIMDRVGDERYWRGFVLPWVEGTSLPPTGMPTISGHGIQTNATSISDASLWPNDANLDGYLVAGTEKTTTTRRVLRDENFAFRYVLDYFRRSLRVVRGYGFLRYNLAVGGDEFLVGAPLFYYPPHPGSPRGYVAFHKQSGRFVFLKDYWRPGGTATSEGDTLRRLNGDGVGNVPTLLCRGVVDGEVSRVPGRWINMEDQREKESRVEDEPRGVKRTQDDLRKEVETTPQTRHYGHYRIAVKEVCLPLTAVTSSRQLVSVVGDCIEAHDDAAKKSRLIHHNISSESIVILPTFSEPEDGDNHTPRVVWRGVLADWEFARAVPQGQHDASESAPRPERTPAAWRHMPVASLMNSASHVLTTADELESFFHVVLHHAIRFFPHNVNATDFINTTFVLGSATEPSQSEGAGAFLCPLNKEIIVAELGVLKLRGKKVVFYRDPQSGTQSAGNRNAPLNHLLSTMLRWLKARYDVLEYESAAPAPSSPTSPGPSLNRDTVTHLPAKRVRDEPGSSNQTDAASIAASGGLSASSSASEDRDAVRPSDKTYELASRVDDHEAVRELFGEALKSQDWPVDDVVGDQWIK